MTTKILEYIHIAYDTTVDFAEKKPLMGVVISVIMAQVGSVMSAVDHTKTLGIITMILGCVTAFFMAIKTIFAAWKEFMELRKVLNDKDKTK